MILDLNELEAKLRDLEIDNPQPLELSPEITEKEILQLEDSLLDDFIIVYHDKRQESNSVTFHRAMWSDTNPE